MIDNKTSTKKTVINKHCNPETNKHCLFGAAKYSSSCIYKNNAGSISVEASFVIPLFLFAMLAIVYMCNAIAVKGVIHEAAVETSEYMAEYSYLADRKGELSILSHVMAMEKFHEYLDDSDLVKTYVSGGTMGVTFIGSHFPDDDGYIRLRVTYRLGINAPLFGKFSKLVSYEIKQKAYLGYTPSDIEENNDDNDTYVYLADNSEVYHKSRTCTYLHYDISEISLSGAAADKRKKCEYCGKNAGDVVYITQYGDRYHSTMSCSRLYRNVRRVKLSEVEGSYPPCSKCGGG